MAFYGIKHAFTMRYCILHTVSHKIVSSMHEVSSTVDSHLFKGFINKAIDLPTEMCLDVPSTKYVRIGKNAE